MIDPTELNARADAVSQELRTRLGLRGKTLAQRLHRAGRLLPAGVQEAGQILIDAQQKAAHPQLAATLDPEAIEAAFATLSEHLASVDPADRRKGMLLGWLAGQATNLLILAALLIALLIWRGFL